MPYAGRGGAGNIQAVEEANKRIAEDLEANQQAAETFTTQPAPTSYEQYARVGRGGAGNFYDPQDANDTDRVGRGDGINSLGSDVIHEAKPTTVSAPEPTRTFGRGGAGNFSFNSSEDQDRALRRRLEEDEQKKQQVKEQVEKGVEETLAMPAKAKLPREVPEP